MSHNTRSQGSRASSESGELSQAELEQINKKLTDKEKLIQEQAQALKSRQNELDKREANMNREKNAAVGIEGLSSILNDLRKEILILNDLPRQVEKLNQRVTELSSCNISQIPQQSLPNSFPVQNPIGSPPDDRNQCGESAYNRPQISESTSPIRFKDVIDSIPKYDGLKISVFQFSKICERALKLISSHQEFYLVQLIINKLQGHAYTAVEGMQFHTVSELLRQLKRIFGPNKSLNQYRGELGNLYMLPNEDIFSYIERTKNLRTAITDGETALRGSLDEYDEYRIDNDILESFINGLSSDLLVRVKLEGRHETLDSAIASTIQLSKTLEAENRRRKPTFPVKTNSAPRVDLPPKSNNPPDRYNETRPHNIIPNSSNLNRAPNLPFIKPLLPGQPGPNFPTEKMCRYCKNPGHLIDECRKLAYRQSNQNVPGPSGQGQATISKLENNQGNAVSIPVSGVHRDANQSGRPILPRAVRFQETTGKLPTLHE